MSTTYMIECCGDDGVWSEGYVTESAEANRFETAEEAQAAMQSLRDLGDPWANAQFRIVEADY